MVLLKTMGERSMKLLDFEEYCVKYGLEELDEFLIDNDLTNDEQDEWLNEAYECYVSEYQCRAYDEWKDDKEDY